MPTAAVAAIVVGGVLLALSTREFVKANPDDLIPWWGKPVHESGRGLVLRLVGFGLCLIGVVFVPQTHVFLGLVLVTLVVLAPVALIVVHNLGVHRRRARDGRG